MADVRDQLQAAISGGDVIERELGGGDMSRVFVVEERRLGRSVAIKVLAPVLPAGINAERFQREIRLAASLQQANIVPVLVASESKRLPYFTMPFVEGRSLRARLGTGPLPVAEAIGILRDIARALDYAHAHGVVHCDIKPDNVLLSNGAAVVTDFGIAKALEGARMPTTGEGDPGTLTALGTTVGTPAYMAPEQAAGDPATDHRADLMPSAAWRMSCSPAHRRSGDARRTNCSWRYMTRWRRWRSPRSSQTTPCARSASAPRRRTA